MQFSNENKYGMTSDFEGFVEYNCVWNFHSNLMETTIKEGKTKRIEDNDKDWELLLHKKYEFYRSAFILWKFEVKGT